MRDHKPIAPAKSTASPSMMSRSFTILTRLRRVTVGSLAVVGATAVAGLGYEMQQRKKLLAEFDYTDNDDNNEDSKEAKKKVLVLPFHRMRLVETKKNKYSWRNLIDSANEGEGDGMIEVEVREVVQVIHAAAADPNIVALYGIFGHGFEFRAGGWAHIEEIRNALKVWRESHRVHLEPNLKHEKVLVRGSNVTPKPSYAFADSFSDPDDKGNKEYLVACAFSHIHMQKNGELNLFGVASSNPFFRSFMEKNGIKAHVFKHGKFKNAPNMFTESGYTKEHRQNVQNLVEQIDTNKRNGIVADRNQKGFDMMVWKLIRKHGTFTGKEALKLGLVDHLPTLDPLDGLLTANKDEASKKIMKKKWGNETDIDKFDATEKLTFSKYASMLAKRNEIEKSQLQLYDRLKYLTDRSSAFESLLGVLGYPTPFLNFKDKEAFSTAKCAGEKIAVINIEGSINDALARKTVASIRKIKADDKVKAVVLRIESPGGSVTASESILQECKDLPQPVVCSMGNVCASGGYYIATGCHRIFALPTTVTGSIGVFGVKFDLTGLARKYGISVQHITTGPYSASSHPFQPLNPLVKTNFSNNVDRYYDYFKSIVAESRGLDMDQVEGLAQGKVWTGGEGKHNGLVDELGGLERAIAFAQRSYTSGDAAVERWPKPESFLDKLMRATEKANGGLFSKLTLMMDAFATEASHQDSNATVINEYDAAKFLIQRVIENPRSVEGMKLGGVSLTMDETAAMSHLIVDNMNIVNESSPLLHPSFWRC